MTITSPVLLMLVDLKKKSKKLNLWHEALKFRFNPSEYIEPQSTVLLLVRRHPACQTLGTSSFSHPLLLCFKGVGSHSAKGSEKSRTHITPLAFFTVLYRADSSKLIDSKNFRQSY